MDAYVPHLVAVLDQTFYTALSDDEIETLIDLLSQVTASAHRLLDERTDL